MNKNEYNEYLQSNHWKEIKKKFRKSKINKRCFVCKTKINLHVHHKTYKNLYKEHLYDFIFLCKTCHEEVHKFLNESRNPKITLWNVAEKYKKLYNSKIKKEKEEILLKRKRKIIINEVKPDKLPPIIGSDGKIIGELNNYKIVNV